jgi:hypothetical protein
MFLRRTTIAAALLAPLTLAVIGGTPTLAGAVAAPTVQLSSSVSPSAMGQAVTFRAKVAIVGTTATAITGTVTFSADGAALGSSAVTSGVGALTTRALHVGAHSIVASFVGTGGSAASPPLAQVVTVGATTTTVVSSKPTATYGDAGAITATVKPVSPAAGVPTGSVDFSVDGGYYWTATLDSTGRAKLALADLYPAFGPGPHVVTAAYIGDGDYAASVTAVGITQTLVGLTAVPVTNLTLSAGGLPVFSVRSFSLRSADPIGCNVTITNSTPTTQSLVYGTPGAWKRLPYGSIAPGGALGVGVGLAGYTGYFATAANPANYVAIHCI